MSEPTRQKHQDRTDFMPPQYGIDHENITPLSHSVGERVPSGCGGRVALLVMVHGSPRPIANTDMFRVVEVMRARKVFPIIEVGFMECNPPTIPEAIEACVSQGATEITAVPYFLHTGTHVADDLPTLLEEGQRRYPQVIFRMGDYLGRSSELTEILAARILACRVPATSS